uniref:Uncharacterized protein n=2 Tax=Canis lupus familiaris TaxID=9615 RepID=A0A8P0TQC0_CANLF
MPPALLFFFKTSLAIWGLLWFHMNCRIVCSSFVKNAGVILIRIELNLWIALCSIDILTIFILSIHKHGMFFQFFVSSSISFISVFSEYRSFTSLIRFIPRYLIIFGAIINGIVSLISFSSASLLVYNNATDFCTLTLFPVILLNSFISSSRVFWWSLSGFL